MEPATISTCIPGYYANGQEIHPYTTVEATELYNKHDKKLAHFDDRWITLGDGTCSLETMERELVIDVKPRYESPKGAFPNFHIHPVYDQQPCEIKTISVQSF